MKYTVVCLLMWCCQAANGKNPVDTGAVKDVLGNRSLLPVAASYKTYRISDTAAYELQLALDRDNRPLYYYRHIFTPVCYTGECKPVYINLYWDLLGNYIRYDLPGKEVLTKLDHKEFKRDDYEKLQDILARPNSLLADLAITDLIVPGTESLSDSVDARTGATLKTIKNEVISGAVYTCYTLWHIAHGTVTDEIARITDTYINPALLHRFLSSSNHAYQYKALEKVMDKNGRIMPGFENDIRTLINGKNIFIARYTLQQVHPGFISGAKAQSWLWDTYTKSVYPLQLTMLRKLATVPLSDAMAKQLANAGSSANEEQFHLILAALQATPHLRDAAIQLLANQLKNTDATRAAAIHALLLQQQPVNHSVKIKMHEYEQTLHPTEK
ncbi:hypothetical protein QFZ51_005465 [Chitinophaga sp. W3I9]|uniref:hypothetical protein n=1 Tax=Chitinophaga sp. W3I9 TaxID=3373924 RepID=UPI003D25C831